MATGVKSVRAAGAGAFTNPARDVQRLALSQRLGRRLDRQDPATARFAAAQMVSELFFKPLLAEARRASCNAAFTDGGQTESIFGEQLDQKLADKVAGKQTVLINAIASKLTQGKT